MADLEAIKKALKAVPIPDKLVDDLFTHFAELKKDFLMGAYYSSAIGQFVEDMVDILVHFQTNGTGSRPRDIDAFLNNLSSTTPSLPESLRLVLARTLRVVNTLRNKRTCHNLEVVPNVMDSGCAVACAQWALAELIRVKAGLSSSDSISAIESITAPIGGIIEDFGEFKTVLSDCSVRDEMLLLFSSYLDWEPIDRLKADMKRVKQGTISVTLNRLYGKKLVEKEQGSDKYKLTGKGFGEAAKVYVKVMALKKPNKKNSKRKR